MPAGNLNFRSRAFAGNEIEVETVTQQSQWIPPEEPSAPEDGPQNPTETEQT